MKTKNYGLEQYAEEIGYKPDIKHSDCLRATHIGSYQIALRGKRAQPVTIWIAMDSNTRLLQAIHLSETNLINDCKEFLQAIEPFNPRYIISNGFAGYRQAIEELNKNMKQKIRHIIVEGTKVK